MDYHYQWLIEGELIYVAVYREPDEATLQQMFAVGKQYIEQSERPLVHFVLDLAHIQQAATLGMVIQTARSQQPHPRTGWVITVGERTRQIRLVSSIARQLLNLRMRSYDALEEALDFLRHVDVTLKWEALQEPRQRELPLHSEE